ncbi:MAG TPA: type IX secretion system membrane protein PorP/SprF [Leeuwenhoekiella sp.]|nr:type IX secretion system membrane protein PorP/SprF [Leeuwenhoekiella sp.]
MLKKIIFVFFIVLTAVVHAQEGIPVYSDYLSDNLYLLHPSMAGAANANQIRLTARQQWFDVDDAPNLQTLSINGRVSDKIGLGAIVFADQNGYFSQTGFYGSFAYHILMSRNTVDLNQFSFGVSVGVLQNTLDEGDFDLRNIDPIITGGNPTDTFFNVDIGMSYYFLDFFAHATVKNVLPRNRKIFTEEFESSNQRRYIASAGYTFGRGGAWKYEPSVMFQATEQTQEVTGDLNFKLYYDLEWGTLWGGASYRRSFDGAEYTDDGMTVQSQKLQYITPLLGVNYKNFLFSYTYSYQSNSVVLSNGGFHQITLGYDFGKRKEPYDCYCPAIN